MLSKMHSPARYSELCEPYFFNAVSGGLNCEADMRVGAMCRQRREAVEARERVM